MNDFINIIYNPRMHYRKDFNSWVKDLYYYGESGMYIVFAGIDTKGYWIKLDYLW